MLKRLSSSDVNDKRDLFDPDVLELVGTSWDPKLSQKVLLIHLVEPVPKDVTEKKLRDLVRIFETPVFVVYEFDGLLFCDDCS